MSIFSAREKTRQGLRRSREGWFSRLAGLLARDRVDEGVWEEAEELLLGADVGVSTAAALLDRVRQRMRSDGGQAGGPLELLKEEMRAILGAGETPSLQNSAGAASVPLAKLLDGVVEAPENARPAAPMFVTVVT